MQETLWEMRFIWFYLFFFLVVILQLTLPAMLPIVQQIAQEYKAALQDLYGAELAALILFGSHARGDYHDESDIDFAVVLTHAGNGLEDIFKTAETSANLEMKYGYPISTLPVSITKLQHSAQGVYQEIRKEGITI